MPTTIQNEQTQTGKFESEVGLISLQDYANTQFDAIKAVYVNKKRVIALGEKFKVNNFVAKIINVIVAKRKMKAMKDNALPKMRPVFDLLRSITPVRKEIDTFEISYSYEVKMCEAEFDPPEIEEVEPVIIRRDFRREDEMRRCNQVRRPVPEKKINVGFSYAESLRLQEQFLHKYGCYSFGPSLDDSLFDMQVETDDDVSNESQPPEEDLTIEGVEPNPGPNNKNKKNNRKRNNNNRKRRPRKRGNNANNNKDLAIVGTNQTALMPNSKMVTFRYLDDNGLRNNGGAQFLAYAFRINDLVDIDPLILSGLISGYKEMMQFYTWARVMGVEIDLHITNNENFPVFYGVVFTNINLVGTLSGVNDAKNALESRNGTTVRTLSAKGGMDRDRIVVRRSLSSIVGSKLQYMTNLDYVNQISTSPTLPIYATFIVYTYGANLGNGVTTALTFSLRTLCSGSTNLRA